MTKTRSSRTTLLDFAILGLILDQPLSGYAIRKLFEETALGNYSSSPGAIYPALNRLQRLNLVRKIGQEKTTKTSFKITETGISTLRTWAIKPIEKEEVKKKTDELLLRFAFMETLVAEEDKINFLTSYRDLLKDNNIELQEYYNNESEGMTLHGRIAFQHGILSNKTNLKWCKEAILQLTQNK